MSHIFTKVTDLSLNCDPQTCNLVVALISATPDDREYRELLVGDSSGCVVVRVSRSSDHYAFLDMEATGTVLLIKNALITNHHSHLKVEIVQSSSIVIQRDIIMHSLNSENNISQVEYILAD